jgi:hypothetical protein
VLVKTVALQGETGVGSHAREGRADVLVRDCLCAHGVTGAGSMLARGGLVTGLRTVHSQKGEKSLSYLKWQFSGISRGCRRWGDCESRAGQSLYSWSHIETWCRSYRLRFFLTNKADHKL